MNNEKGFSLVELVVAIIIIGILSIVSVPIYRGYVKRAYGSEGRALLGSILTAEKHFCIDNDSFANEGETSIGANIDVDASGNKYFKTFSVVANGEDSFTATTNGTGAANGITLTLEYSSSGTQVYETYANEVQENSGSQSGGATYNPTNESQLNNNLIQAGCTFDYVKDRYGINEETVGQSGMDALDAFYGQFMHNCGPGGQDDNGNGDGEYFTYVGLTTLEDLLVNGDGSFSGYGYEGNSDFEGLANRILQDLGIEYAPRICTLR